MQTRDGRLVRTGPGVMPGPADTYVAYGKGWANVSNTPFREYKHWIHEGGIATPLIVHWPAGIPNNRRGKIEAQPGHIIDIMATCVDLAGARYPTEVNAKKIKPMEGVSLKPAFQGDSLKRATTRSSGSTKATAPYTMGNGNSSPRPMNLGNFTTWKRIARKCTTWPPANRTKSKNSRQSGTPGRLAPTFCRWAVGKPNELEPRLMKSLKQFLALGLALGVMNFNLPIARRGKAEHHHHPRRRLGLRRPGLLWPSEHPHAESGSHGGGGLALHAVLRWPELLHAESCGAVDRSACRAQWRGRTTRAGLARLLPKRHRRSADQ